MTPFVSSKNVCLDLKFLYFISLYITKKKQTKNTKYQTTGTVPEENRQIVEIETNLISLTHINVTAQFHGLLHTLQ
jgi:hypothetical protein